MQWKNHRLTTCAIVYSLTGSIPATAIATASSVLPDVMEARLLKNISLVKHRTLTHYPWLYLVPAVILWRLLQSGPNYVGYLVFFILVGCLCHLAEDFMSRSGIPLLTPGGKHTGLNFYITKCPSEGFAALAIIALALLYDWRQGMITQGYLTQAANNTASFFTGLIRFYWKA